jgi:hypothetical protein
MKYQHKFRVKAPLHKVRDFYERTAIWQRSLPRRCGSGSPGTCGQRGSEMDLPCGSGFFRPMGGDLSRLHPLASSTVKYAALSDLDPQAWLRCNRHSGD